MKHLLSRLIGLTLAAAIALPAVTHAACSDGEKRVLKSSGASDARITSLCDQGFSAPLVGERIKTNICQTPTASCVATNFVPVGVACWCNSGNGPVNGRAVLR